MCCKSIFRHIFLNVTNFNTSQTYFSWLTVALTDMGGGGALFVKLDELELLYLPPSSLSQFAFKLPQSAGRRSIFQVAKDSDKIPDKGRKMLLWDYFRRGPGHGGTSPLSPSLLGVCVILLSDIDHLKVLKCIAVSPNYRI
jgi:hypothetical protein